MKHDIESLSERISATGRLIGETSDQGDVEELLRIIHNPGFTTPAEWLLIHGYLNAIDTALRQVNALRSTLLEGSRVVGKQESLA